MLAVFRLLTQSLQGARTGACRHLRDQIGNLDLEKYRMQNLRKLSVSLGRQQHNGLSSSNRLILTPF
jgi:hypothetical protein